jgi:hypothetical protein
LRRNVSSDRGEGLQLVSEGEIRVLHLSYFLGIGIKFVNLVNPNIGDAYVLLAQPLLLGVIETIAFRR